MAELVGIRLSPSAASKHSDSNTDFAIVNTVCSDDADIKLNEADGSDAENTMSIGADRLQLQGTTISFHNIRYTVDTKVNKKKTKKDIVKGISGIFPPGMNAILGPTGCGKTTTLDILADRKDMSRVTGYIMVDGAKTPSNFKRMTGYVVQHDVVMGILTVRENIYFSAALRLPSSMSGDEKKEKVDKLIHELGLSKVADSKVGTDLIRGISGGEIRRTGIGMELIISPHVLFLDEPTTGLDASTASSVMQLLHDLSRKGNTIIFSIHQPRYSIFKLFDHMCLLANGRTVYHGPAQEALGYFRGIGYECEAHNNPPDFFLDVINSINISNCEENEDTNDLENGNLNCVDLAQKYKESSYGQSMDNEVEGILKKMKANPDTSARDNSASMKHFATGYLTQFLIVGQRSVRSLIRNPQTSIIQLCVMIFFGVIVGALYFQLDKGESGIQNRAGAFFFIIMNMVFANMDSIELLIKERAIFIHESASGYYRVSVYLLSKIFAEFLPYRTFSSFIFATIVYWMVGFTSDVGKYFTFVLTVVLVSITACSVSFVLSATFGIFAIANLMTAVCYVVMMVFGGLLLNQQSFGDWIGWLKYFSIFKYGMESMSINELNGMQFSCSNETTASPSGSFCVAGTLDGSKYLDVQGIDVDMLWWNEFILFAMSTALCFLTYIQLRRVNKDK